MTPHTDARAPVVTIKVAYPKAFAPYSAPLKLSSGFGNGADSMDCELEEVKVAGREGEGLGLAGLMTEPNEEVLRGGGGASCRDFESIIERCRLSKTTGTTRAAVVRAS